MYVSIKLQGLRYTIRIIFYDAWIFWRTHAQKNNIWNLVKFSTRSTNFVVIYYVSSSLSSPATCEGWGQSGGESWVQPSQQQQQHPNPYRRLWIFCKLEDVPVAPSSRSRPPRSQVSFQGPPPIAVKKTIQILRKELQCVNLLQVGVISGLVLLVPN